MAGRKRSMSDARPGASKKRRTDARKTSRVYSARTAFPAETKYFDTTFSATVPATADWAASNIPMTSFLNNQGALTAYTDSPIIPSSNGSGYGEVVGNKYLLKAVRCRGELQITAVSAQAVALQNPMVRVVLVLDTQPNGAQETGPNVFTDLGGAPQCNYSFQQMAAGMPGRFKILGSVTKSIVHSINWNDAAGTGTSVFCKEPFEFTKAWKRGLKICIKSNAGGTPAIANYTDASIFLMAHSAAAAGYVCTIVGANRAYYID